MTKTFGRCKQSFLGAIKASGGAIKVHGPLERGKTHFWGGAGKDQPQPESVMGETNVPSEMELAEPPKCLLGVF